MFLAMLLIWIGFNGKFTLEILLFGVALSAAICIFCSKTTGYRLRWELRLLATLPAVLGYALNMIREVLLANLAVAKLILSGKEPKPMLSEFNPHFMRDSNWVVLANSITLTPGTITARMEHGQLTVHCLVPEMAEGLDRSSFVTRIRKMEANGRA